MKFKFNLETLLKERGIRKNEAQKDFKTAQAKLFEQQAKLIELQNQSSDARNKQINILSGSGKFTVELQTLEEFVQGQKIRILKQREIIKGLEEILEQKRQVLLESMKEVKVLEKLKEKRYNEFKIAKRKLEAKNTDEVAIIRAARSMTE